MCSLSHRELIAATAKLDGAWTRNGQDYCRISQCFRQEANSIITRTRQVTNLFTLLMPLIPTVFGSTDVS